MAKETTTSPAAVYNLLASGTTINGDIHSDSDLRLDGRMVGDIVTTGKVILGPVATLKGNIKSSNAEICGEVCGDVDAPEQLMLRSQAKVTGTIRTSTLVVESGAIFDGACQMVQNA
jgi:cytoskeletal protein CcmA (bactofilin family)